MGRQRFKDNTNDSFFGQFLYKQVVPPEHFLMQLQRIIPWERFSARLVQYYKGQARLGRAPYDPVVLLKMLLLSYLYNISERQVEDYCNFYLPAKCFLGLGVDERPPDHSTLSAFKGRLLQNGNLGVFEQLLSEIISIALEKGIKFGSLQIIDSTHVVANVNVQKDKDKESCQNRRPLGDKHASLGNDDLGNLSVTLLCGPQCQCLLTLCLHSLLPAIGLKCTVRGSAASDVRPYHRSSAYSVMIQRPPCLSTIM